MKWMTFCGTSLGEGKTACISCAGKAWSVSTGRTLAGKVPAGVPGEVLRTTLVENLRFAAMP